MLFAVGDRPSADEVDRLLSLPRSAESAVIGSPAGGVSARISHRPEGNAGWLEILAGGLTFDLTGLSPGLPGQPPAARHFFGLPEKSDAFAFEAVTLAPGPHVTAGAGMLPLVRIMIGLSFLLVRAPGVKAVCWHPAGSWMDPGYFLRVVSAWLSGGAFPALGLTAIDRSRDGGVESDGLGFFIGQELCVGPRKGEITAETVKLAVRMIDYLVRQGRLTDRQELKGPDGETLVAELLPDGRRLRLLREV